MRLFTQLALVSLILSFSVILAGGVVRMTGSGMGCPDWPKCFGQYIPPTDISQLPPNYKILFAVKGKEIADFDAFKTWVEYINRLLGAVLGIVIIVMTGVSFQQRKNDKWLPILSVVLLLVTGFVGWLGSVVVATDLEPVKISLHMLTSVVIVGVAATIHHRASIAKQFNTSGEEVSNRRLELVVPRNIHFLVIFALLLTLVQIIIGTQVREQIDVIAKQLEGRWREQWIEQLSGAFLIHRSMSWLFVIINGAIVWYGGQFIGTRPEKQAIQLRRLFMGLVTIVIAEIALGVIMAYFAIPKIAQPLHLLLSMVLFAVQWKSFLVLQELHLAEKKI